MTTRRRSSRDWSASGPNFSRSCSDLNETVKLLLARGPEIRAQLITHVVPYDDAPAFIARLVGERPEFLQIVFRSERDGEAVARPRPRDPRAAHHARRAL